MPLFKLPLSGDVTQSILPWTFAPMGGQWGLVNITLGQSTAPEVEADVLTDVAGYGKQLALIVRGQTLLWMEQTSTHRAQATCSPQDRAARVFLRAIGYRQETLLEAGAEDGSDLLQFKFIRRRFHHGQISTQGSRPAEASRSAGRVGREGRTAAKGHAGAGEA